MIASEEYGLPLTINKHASAFTGLYCIHESFTTDNFWNPTRTEELIHEVMDEHVSQWLHIPVRENAECVIDNSNDYMVFAAAAAYNDVFESGYTCDAQNEEGYSEIGGFARLSGGLMAICDYHLFEQRGRLMRPLAVLREVIVHEVLHAVFGAFHTNGQSTMNNSYTNARITTNGFIWRFTRLVPQEVEIYKIYGDQNLVNGLSLLETVEIAP